MRGSTDPLRLRDQLSVAEMQVMELIAAGLRNGEIARRLWRSEKTIEKHVGRIFSKLGLDESAHDRFDRRVLATRVFLSEATDVASGASARPSA